MSKKAMVYVVTVDYDHETRTPVKAFRSQAAADHFVHDCLEYAGTWRPCPGVDGNDATWEKWYRWLRRWCAKHPAGREHAVNGISLSVTEVELSP